MVFNFIESKMDYLQNLLAKFYMLFKRNLIFSFYILFLLCAVPGWRKSWKCSTDEWKREFIRPFLLGVRLTGLS
jgi:hypothetical protein